MVGARVETLRIEESYMDYDDGFVQKTITPSDGLRRNWEWRIMES